MNHDKFNFSDRSRLKIVADSNAMEHVCKTTNLANKNNFIFSAITRAINDNDLSEMEENKWFVLEDLRRNALCNLIDAYHQTLQSSVLISWPKHFDIANDDFKYLKVEKVYKYDVSIIKCSENKEDFENILKDIKNFKIDFDGFIECCNEIMPKYIEDIKGEVDKASSIIHNILSNQFNILTSGKYRKLN
jgi:hypothetical protein